MTRGMVARYRNISLELVDWLQRPFSRQGGKGLKAATAVNVRHILCEKHSKATEALAKIQVSQHIGNGDTSSTTCVT